MIVVVVGCGRLGASLAARLQRRGARVSVIDRTSAAFANLPVDFMGLTVEGSGLSEDVLLRARIKEATALAAVTNSDATNAVVGHIAKHVFQVPRVVLRNYDPRNHVIFEAFELEAISSTAWGAQRLEELIFMESFETVYSFGSGEVQIYALRVDSDWAGKSAGELVARWGANPVALTRRGRAILPTSETLLEMEDILYICSSAEKMLPRKTQLKGR